MKVATPFLKKNVLLYIFPPSSSSPAPGNNPPPPHPAWPHLSEGQLHLQVSLEIVLGHGFSILQHLVGRGPVGLGDLVCRQHLQEERKGELIGHSPGAPGRVRQLREGGMVRSVPRQRGDRHQTQA